MLEIAERSSRMPSLSEDDRNSDPGACARQGVSPCDLPRAAAFPPFQRRAFFAERRGLFVTLHVRQENLRGCIGMVEGKCGSRRNPDEVRRRLPRCTIRAFFPGCGQRKWTHWKFEVSLLSPLQPIRPEEVENRDSRAGWWSGVPGGDCCYHRWPWSTG